DPSQIEYLIKTHQYPQPRLDVLPLLASFDRVAGMDTSDGLADALVQICGASGVDARVAARQIPMDEGLRLIFPDHTLEWALYGGEDFELLLSLPPAHAHSLVAALPGSAVIGEVVPAVGDPGVVEVIGWGQLDRAQGFAHFS
ncbi:MAG: thiamine-monophosphate kinase, partial [Cyanophyceae cyanobacterium]